jgi:hypothetical protein
MHLKNLVTGGDMALHGVTTNATISGTTVYYAQPVGATDLHIFALAHADQAGATPRALPDEPAEDANYIDLAANARLLSVSLSDQGNLPPIYHFWDFAQQRLIDLPIVSSTTALIFFPTLRGSALAYETQTGTHAQIVLWNTAALPTLILFCR